MKKIIASLMVLMLPHIASSSESFQNKQIEIKEVAHKTIEGENTSKNKNAFLKEQMFEPSGEVIKSYNSKPFSAYFSWQKKDGFFKYEDYEKYLKKEDKTQSDLFKGIIINNEHGRIISDYQLYENPDLSVENLSKHVIDMRAYNLFEKLTGFQLTNYTQSMKDTAFLFIDFEYQPRKTAKYLMELKQYAKNMNKNIIIFPIAFLNDDSIKEAFDTLKLFALDLPENILEKTSADVSIIKDSMLVSEEIAQRLYDGIDSNNLIYYMGLGLANEMSLIRLDNGKFKITHDFLEGELFSKFFN